MTQITVFSKNNCMQCKMTKRFLEEHGVDFKEINIDEQPEYIDTLKEAGFMATPVIKADGIEPFSGFRPDQLNKLAVMA
ncbi:redoxin NrdH [Nicoliella spurrieriana]|uniref:Glutaredoxin-like protein NrdH n=1 Tax=Nicoliella spurrieriana TaxID=2925830 RepID=A0A976RSG8_9LACO|nr:redoxin NrdH [Nicoliella spurrieriana]UQS87007.1 redoxin NrdH [Nicoliella spurrieriana]